MNLSELRTEVRDVINRSVDAFSNADIDENINRVLRVVAIGFTFEDMRKTYSTSTIADQKIYNYPTDMKDVYSLRLIDGASSRKLLVKNQRAFDKMYPYPEQQSTGRPEVYVDYGSYFQVHRVPDAAYEIHMRCSIYPAVMSTDAAEPLITGIDPAIVAGASAFSFARIREPEFAEYWNGVYLRLIQNAIGGNHSAEDWTPTGVGFSLLPSAPRAHDNPFAGRTV